MRIAWVHPSWRDLVIDDLAADADARRRFLTAAGLEGVLLALSTAGGARGERLLPLLVADADWDALADRVHALAPELDARGHARLLDALAAATAATAERDPARHREVAAIAEQALARAAGLWNRAGRELDVDLLRSWYALAERVPSRPEPPTLDRTWAALLPVSPDLDDPSERERAVAWLALCELLSAYDVPALDRLGLRDRQAGRHAALSAALREAALEDDRPWEPFVPGEDPAPLDPYLDVQRILRDLA